MNRALQGLLVAVSTLALAACGGQGGAKLGGGKQGAAQAMYQASQPLTGSGGSAPLQPSSTGAAVTVNGAHGGTASVTFSGTGTSGTGSFAMTTTYSHFNADGKNTYDGTITLTMSTHVSGTSVSTQLVMQGHLTLSGDISDTLDMNVTESVAVNTAIGGAANASVTLSGTITTSTATYQYTNDTFSLAANAELPRG